MDFLQSLLDNSSIPAITAFILGILTAVSPCPLATNITAIGFISKDIEHHHRIFINGLPELKVKKKLKQLSMKS